MLITGTQGLEFPLVLTDGKNAIAEGDTLIKSSIRTILSWPLHDREHVDDFGSRIEEALEDPNDGVLLTLLRKFIIDALEQWERRIELKRLRFYRTTPEKLLVEITYLIKDIHIEDTLNYTFHTN